MKITNQQLKQIIKEEFNKVVKENEDALMMNKFAFFMSSLNFERTSSILHGLLKRIKSNDTDSGEFEVLLREFKKLIKKSYDVKFNGKSIESDLQVIKEIAKLVKEWKETDNLDRQKKDKIVALMFFRLPQLSPIK